MQHLQLQEPPAYLGVYLWRYERIHIICLGIMSVVWHFWSHTIKSQSYCTILYLACLIWCIGMIDIFLYRYYLSMIAWRDNIALLKKNAYGYIVIALWSLVYILGVPLGSFFEPWLTMLCIHILALSVSCCFVVCAVLASIPSQHIHYN
jgi:hypothetical protein